MVTKISWVAAQQLMTLSLKRGGHSLVAKHAPCGFTLSDSFMRRRQPRDKQAARIRIPRFAKLSPALFDFYTMAGVMLIKAAVAESPQKLQFIH